MIGDLPDPINAWCPHCCAAPGEPCEIPTSGIEYVDMNGPRFHVARYRANGEDVRAACGRPAGGGGEVRSVLMELSDEEVRWVEAMRQGNVTGTVKLPADADVKYIKVTVTSQITTTKERPMRADDSGPADEPPEEPDIPPPSG